MSNGREKEHSVMVSGFVPGTTVEDLSGLFQSQGFTNITDVYLPARKGFGFVRFNNPEDADNAAQLDGQLELHGAALKLEVSYSGKKRPAELARTSGPSSPIGKGGKAGKGGTLWGPTVEPLRPAKRERGEFSIWVGNLNSATADDLRAAFESCGVETMTDVYLPPGKAFGFVRFATQEDADDAMSRVQGLQLDGSELEFQVSDGEKRDRRAPESFQQSYVQSPRAPSWSGGYGEQYGLGQKGSAADSKRPSEFSVWVGNLPDTLNADELRAAFESRGVESMTDVYIPFGKGFGFVRFGTREEVEEAIPAVAGLHLHGADLEFKASFTEKRRQEPPVEPVTSYGGGYAREYSGGWAAGAPAPAIELKKQRSPEISVKVNNIPPRTTADQLQQAFVDQGVDTMTDVYVPSGRAYGFIRFASLSEANVALRCSGMTIGGSTVTCEMAEGEKKTSQEIIAEQGYYGGKGCGSAVAYHYDDDAFQKASTGRAGEVSVKFSNLPHDATPEEVVEAFAQQGVDSMTDCYIPPGKRFGFARFASDAEGQHALQQSVAIRGVMLDLEMAVGKKRGPQEMASGEAARYRSSMPPRETRDFPPENLDASLDTPSVKVSGVPPGTGSDQLRQALLRAGCPGSITDVYIPKGDRGFGFVRFSRQRDAEMLCQLRVSVRGAPLGMEMAVSARKGAKREAPVVPADRGMYGPGMSAGGGWSAGDGWGPPAGGGWGPPSGFGYGPGMAAKGGWGPAPRKGGFVGGGKVGPYIGKGYGW